MITESSKHTTSAWLSHAALAAAQAAFVVGSIYLKGAIKQIDSGEHFSPVVFLFLREALAGPLLLAAAWCFTGASWPTRHDLPRVLGLGVCLSGNQLFYLKGMDWAGVAMATSMQPAIPVFTVTLAVCLRMEAAHPQKLLGIGLAVTGAVSIVLGSALRGSSGTAGPAGHKLLGSICLVLNTACMAVYYILAKQVLRTYPPLLVTTWAYLIGATCVGAVAAVTTSATDWVGFPIVLIGPLVYWVLLCSVGAYFLVTWATRHLPPSEVAAFPCLQPFLGTLLAFSLLGEAPSWWDVGAVGIVAGLLLTARAPDGPTPELLGSTSRSDRDTKPILTRED